MKPCFLNLKTCFSFFDSLLTPEEAVRLALEHGCEAAAITDPNLHGAVRFFQAAREAGLRPILGAELDWQGRRMLAYVTNAIGYRHLCALLSQGVGASPPPEALEGLLLFPAALFPAVRTARPGEEALFEIVQSIRLLELAGRAHPAKRRGPFHPRPASPEASAAARQILEACQFDFEWGGLKFPRYAPPDGSHPRAFLERLAREGLHRRYGPQAPRYEPQLREELEMIVRVGYEEYFLLVWELLEDCRREGISWITRGSAADSLVCYCLGISHVCPIRFELYFKRFLNPERMAMAKLPDIDVDFAHDERERVVDKIFARHGVRAAVVGGLSTCQGKSAFADIAKALGVAERTIRRLTEHMPRAPAREFRAAVAQVRECAQLDLGEDPYATALALASRLDGFPRHAKMHPCGVVLSREPVASLCPLFMSASGRPTTQFDMEAVEALGLVKMDILAQGGLAVMRDALGDIARREGRPPPLPQPDGAFDDPEVWNMIAGGQARGVHHIESPAMTSLNRMAATRRIEDLIAVVSVIRPGAANTLRKVSFARRAQGLEPAEYAHPSLEPILRSTYGVVAYEEHVLQICETFAGMSPGRADLLRRALVKNRPVQAAALRGEFEEGARRAGRGAEEIEAVWNLLMGFRGYAFCKAHSTAYGVEAYQAAWLKAHYPAEFLAAVLTHGKGFYDRLTYSIECRRLGIGFLPPDVNRSAERYIVEHGANGQPALRVPLWQIRGLSDATLERLYRQRPFSRIDEVAARARPSADELEALARAGALDGFGLRRTELFWDIRRILRHGANEMPLLREATPRHPFHPPPEPPEAPLERLRDEMELLGFPVSGHPLELYPEVAWDTYCPISRLEAFAGSRVVIAGMVVASRLHHQADGRPMKFLTLCDPSGLVECELFARAYARFGFESIRHPILEAEALVQPFDNANGCTLQILALRAPRTRRTRARAA